MQVHLTIPRYLRIGPQATPVSAKKLCADCQCVLRAANETGRCSVHQAEYELRLARRFIMEDRRNNSK